MPSPGWQPPGIRRRRCCSSAAATFSVKSSGVGSRRWIIPGSLDPSPPGRAPAGRWRGWPTTLRWRRATPLPVGGPPCSSTYRWTSSSTWWRRPPSVGRPDTGLPSRAGSTPKRWIRWSMRWPRVSDRWCSPGEDCAVPRRRAWSTWWRLSRRRHTSTAGREAPSRTVIRCWATMPGRSPSRDATWCLRSGSTGTSARPMGTRSVPRPWSSRWMPTRRRSGGTGRRTSGWWPTRLVSPPSWRSAADRFARADTPGWTKEIMDEEESRQASAEAEAASDDSPVQPQRFGREVGAFFGTESIVAVDGGDIVSTTARWLQVSTPGHVLDPGPFGTLGTGVPYAIAAKVAYPDKLVGIVFGDGAFGFNGFEYDTLVRLDLPVVGVLGNDGVWNNIRTFHRAMFPEQARRLGTRPPPLPRGGKRPGRSRRVGRGSRRPHSRPGARPRLRQAFTGRCPHRRDDAHVEQLQPIGLAALAARCAVLGFGFWASERKTERRTRRHLQRAPTAAVRRPPSAVPPSAVGGGAAGPTTARSGRRCRRRSSRWRRGAGRRSAGHATAGRWRSSPKSPPPPSRPRPARRFRRR